MTTNTQNEDSGACGCCMFAAAVVLGLVALIIAWHIFLFVLMVLGVASLAGLGLAIFAPYFLAKVLLVCATLVAIVWLIRLWQKT